MCMEFAVIGGKENNDRLYSSIINKILSIAISRGNRDIDVDKFKSSMLCKMGESDASACDILKFFNLLSNNEQIEIIDSCCNNKPNTSINNYRLRDIHDVIDVYNKRTNSDIRKLIKYSKNPMEKKALQRELSNKHFMNGKHYKGRR